MATPTPIRTLQVQTQPQSQPQQQQPLHHIKSAARKLPIKRKPSCGPPTSSPSPTRSIPTAIITTTTSNLANPQPFSIIVDDGDDGGNLTVVAAPSANDIDDDYDGESDGAESDPSPTSAAAMGQPATVDGAVPFKFHRIWSEIDEIRFLEGLLACHGEGLVFPRDLNLFFDRFRGTMTTPYSRSQLSEKLRRLRKKFRIASSRIARGLSPAAMSPHDRALYDLSARLWHPSFAEGSPFAPPGTDAPKRRRRLPSAVEDHQQISNNSSATTYTNHDQQNSYSQPPQQNSYHDNDPAKPNPLSVNILPSPPPISTPTAEAPALPLLENGPTVLGDAEKSSFLWLTPKKEPCTAVPVEAPVSTPAYLQEGVESVGEPNQGSMKQMVVKAVLDVFDDAVKDAQLLLPPVSPAPSWSEQLAMVDPASHLLLFRRAEFAKKWQEQRAAELNAVASRLRLFIERTIQG